jgi:hypothetical protein
MEDATNIMRTLVRSNNTARLTSEEFPNSVALAQHAADTKAAIDAVAEYIAANDEYDDAARYNGESVDIWAAGFAKADIRRAAAHARMKGEV